MGARKFLTISVMLGVTVAGTAGSLGAAGAVSSVRAPGWGPVVNLSPAEPSWNLLPTSAAVDSRGNTLAVWEHTHPSRVAVMSAFRRAGGGWAAPVPVPGAGGPDREGNDAQVAFDGSGHAVVAYISGRRVGAVRRTAGGAWAKPVTLFRSPPGVEGALPSGLDLAVNERGQAVVTWVSRGLKAAVASAGGRWGGVRTVARPGGSPDVVIDRWGRSTLVWGSGGWVSRVMTARRDPGGAWTRPRALTRSSWGIGAIGVAVRRDGQVAVAWQTPVGKRSGVEVARKSRRGGWVRTAARALPGDPWKPRLGIDGSGTVTIAWMDLPRGALWRVQNSPRAGWGRPVRVTKPGTAGDDYWLAVNDAGNALLGWTSKPGAHAVQAVYRSRTGGWQIRPSTVSAGRGETRGPAIALGATGTAVMVWTFQPQGSSTSRVQASLLTP